MNAAAAHSPHTAAPNAFALPAISADNLWRVVTAGALATVAFDVFGQALAPMLGFAKLAPIPLASQTWTVVFGQPFAEGGHILHYLAGVFAYAIGWAYVWQPIVQRAAPGVPWVVSAIVYGAALWVLALYIIAHLIAGNPAFLGFTGITWVALAGHIVYAVVAAFAWQKSAN